MMAIPSEEAIQDFIVITNATRGEALKLLQANNNDANRAINAFFEGPGSSQPQGAWPMNPPQSPPRAFTIDRDETGYSAAPSRPPSRSGNDVHMSVEEVPAQENKGMAGYLKKHADMTIAEREEHEMQRAMAASLSRAGGQETGVIGTNEIEPRPSVIPSSSRALIPYKPALKLSMELPDPDPEERTREGDLPVFLRPSKLAQYLGACFTILQHIPLAKEALLGRNKTIADYGYDPSWWNGEKISTPPDPHSIGGDDKPSALFLETQRLSAFLHGTDRAFGSVEALANILSPYRDQSFRFVIDWLERWQNEYDHIEGARNIFKTTIMTDAKNHSEVPLCMAELVIHPEDRTLYDVIDRNLWWSPATQSTQDTWLGVVAPVFIVRLAVQPGIPDKVEIEIPLVWYADRYLEENKEIAWRAREHITQTASMLEMINKIIFFYSTAKGAGGLTTPFKPILDKALAAVDKIAAYRSMASNGTIQSLDPLLSAGESKKLTDDLTSLSQKIERNIKTLEETKEQILEEQERKSLGYSGLGTENDTNSSKRKFTLRGVCTHDHVVFVLKKVENVAALLEAYPGAPIENEWLWWRISYSVEDAKAKYARRCVKPAHRMTLGGVPYELDSDKPRVQVGDNVRVTGYTMTPVRAEEATQAASEDTTTALLIYADDEAVNSTPPTSDLPEPLQAFVNADNKAFEEEILKVKSELEPFIMVPGDKGNEEDAAEGEEFVENVLNPDIVTKPGQQNPDAKPDPPKGEEDTKMDLDPDLTAPAA